MESGNNDSLSNQQPNTTVLCAKGCGFFGSPATMNMCSKCFREHHKPQQPQQTQMSQQSSSKTSSSTPSPSVTHSSGPSAPKVAAEEKGGDEKSVVDKDVVAGSDIPKKKVQKNRKRCFSCRRKVGLTGFECKCGYVYCAEHRYSDKHDCDFDYKSSAREQLTKANPVVIASKLEKI